MHFKLTYPRQMHDTYGMGKAYLLLRGSDTHTATLGVVNSLIAVKSGVRTVDSSGT